MRTASFCSAISLFVFALAGVVRAQAPAAETERCTIPVTVADMEGKLVEGLKAENFRATVHGSPVKIVSATRDRSPKRIVLLIDTSGSMGEQRKMEVAWITAQNLVRALGNDHAIAILTVGDGVQRLTGLLMPASRLDKIVVQASKDQPKGRSQLFDAIPAAVHELEPPQFGDLICIISDAADNWSNVSMRQLRLTLSRAGARLYQIWVPNPRGFRSLGVREMENGMMLSELCLEFGGYSVELDTRVIDPRNIEGLKQRFYPRMTDVYRVEVGFPATLPKKGSLKLEVVDEQGRANKKLQIVYPRTMVERP